jgi:hypothetical protein
MQASQPGKWRKKINENSLEVGNIYIEGRAESCVKLNMNLVDNLLYFFMLDLIILSGIHTCKNKLNYLEYP